MSEYPTKEAWDYFIKHKDDIRSVCENFLSVPRMEIPNTRVYARDETTGVETETDQRGSMPFPVGYTIADFDAAVAARDTDKLASIMNSAWLRAPESRSVYEIPGFTQMCNLLDCTIDGFFDPHEDG